MHINKYYIQIHIKFFCNGGRAIYRPCIYLPSYDISLFLLSLLISSLQVRRWSLWLAEMSGGGYLKKSWPELVGTPGHYAHDMIHKDRPDVQIPVLVVGTQVPPGFDDKRVRLFVHQDFNLKVALTPVVG